MGLPTTEPRPIRRLTLALRITLIVDLLFIVLRAAGYGLQAVAVSHLLPDDYVTPFYAFEGSGLADMVLMWSGLMLIPVGLFAGFLTLKWSYRSNRNAHVFAHGLENTPKWAIWWWFIPFACLFKPYAVISEVWRSAIEPDHWKSLKDPVLLRWWWGAHLAAGFGAVIGSELERSATTAGQVMAIDLFSLIALLIQIASTLLYLRVIGRIEPLQTALIAQGRRRAEDTGAPSWAP